MVVTAAGCSWHFPTSTRTIGSVVRTNCPIGIRQRAQLSGTGRPWNVNSRAPSTYKRAAFDHDRLLDEHRQIYFPNTVNRRHSIKTESNSPSPDPPFNFSFSSPASSTNHSDSSLAPSSHPSLFTFGSLMSWPPPSPNNTAPLALHESDNFEIPSGIQDAIAFGVDEFDDLQELVDLQPMSSNLTESPIPGEKVVRRRSSKACDQCRKCKCKCERVSADDPCKSCIMLGTPCTFLGPSRKRGPPKGYIDAIEARLHQTEALLGILTATADERAQSLLRDLSKDPLAREIIKRVDSSPYGSKTNKQDAGGGASKSRSAHNSEPDHDVQPKTEGDQLDLRSTHPSNEWQSHVVALLEQSPTHREPPSSSDQAPPQYTAYALQGQQPLYVVTTTSDGDEQQNSPTRRQRRRVGGDEFSASQDSYGCQLQPPTISDGFGHGNRSLNSSSPSSAGCVIAKDERGQRRSTSPQDSSSAESDPEVADAVGQLSLNEDEQVRYHGKASGLHLLGVTDRVDTRNEGGIWRFPKPGVWPPLRSSGTDGLAMAGAHDDDASQLPDPAEQDYLLDLYFTFVHPQFPILHKETFFEALKATRSYGDLSQSHSPNASSNEVPCAFNRRHRHVPSLLLLTMFAIAARYSTRNVPPPPPDGSLMWDAGHDYYDRAKVLLDSSYASSRPSTCQTLLLMGYREIGLGAMAPAWTYIGMAVRMAQDLGMHRSADGWTRVGLGGRLFSEWELHERKRIWYGCVIIDKYVSTYIGRPLSIFERDFDTQLPSETESEEFEGWTPHTSDTDKTKRPESAPVAPIQGRIISCFNASATLSTLLSQIVQALYAVHPVASRHSESVYLESLLDKWYIELPDHLRHEPGSSKHPVPLPHVLTLHMQYWCAVLLLHRPFIRHCSPKSKHSDIPEDGEARAITERSYELCAAAANHITAIVSTYLENYPLSRCSVFLCYYIFSASVMHVTTLTAYPSDPQARVGLTKCMDALKKMEIVWPSAGRALDLLAGSKFNLQEAELAALSHHQGHRKRSAAQALEVESSKQGQVPNGATDYPPLRSQDYDTPAKYVNDGGKQAYTNGVDLPSGVPYVNDTGNSVSYLPSYARWPSDANIAQPFPGSLSTSVLSQLYSTGLVDEHAPPGIHMYSNAYDRHDAYEKGSRYSQYWNHYVAAPQLATAYGHVPVGLDQQTQAHSGQVQANPPTPYLAEQYNRYMTNQTLPNP